jgi:hypothetical protein
MRKSFPGVLALSVLLLSALPVQAEDLAVTVYNSNLGVVKDTRSFDLDNGYNEISLVDIAARIDPTSVRINLDGQGEITVVEQNFQYDLLSPAKLMEKYLDDRVSLVTQSGKEFEGTLLGFDNASMVVELDRGGVVIVSREQVTDVSLPPGRKDLIVKPTLVYQVHASRGTRATAEVAYMTEGMNWHAEYVAVLGEGDRSMDLSSWVSIDNKSGATYRDARLKLIAGDVHRVAKKAPMMIEAPTMMDARYAGAPQPIEEKAFFEYHMYTVPRPTTVKDREVKQIQFLPETEIETEKIYNFDSHKSQNVRVVMEFENSEGNNLGVPLPEGKVRVYKADDDGSLEFIGEDRIEHTPKDEDVKVYVGDAFDIVAERTRTNFDRVSDRVVMETYEIKLRNHKEEAIEVVVSEYIYGDWSIRKASHEYEKKKADLVEFVIPVEVDGETILTYTVRRRY